MPVVKKGKKWAIGSGKAIYKTKKSAEKAYAGYRASKHATSAKQTERATSAKRTKKGGKK